MTEEGSRSVGRKQSTSRHERRRLTELRVTCATAEDWGRDDLSERITIFWNYVNEVCVEGRLKSRTLRLTNTETTVFIVTAMRINITTWPFSGWFQSLFCWIQQRILQYQLRPVCGRQQSSLQSCGEVSSFCSVNMATLWEQQVNIFAPSHVTCVQRSDAVPVTDRYWPN